VLAIPAEVSAFSSVSTVHELTQAGVDTLLKQAGDSILRKKQTILTVHFWYIYIINAI
jgi:hypothetical protein